MTPGLLLPADHAPGSIVLPPGVKRRENDPKVDDVLYLASIHFPRKKCPVCGRLPYLVRYLHTWPRSWVKLPCPGCHGRGLL